MARLRGRQDVRRSMHDERRRPQVTSVSQSRSQWRVAVASRIACQRKTRSIVGTLDSNRRNTESTDDAGRATAKQKRFWLIRVCSAQSAVSVFQLLL